MAGNSESKKKAKSLPRTDSRANAKGCKIVLVVDGVRRVFRFVPAAINELPFSLQSENLDHQAASDDACGISAAKATTPTVVSTARPACAEVAGDRANENTAPEGEDEAVELPPGTEALPPDGPGFVSLVNARVNLPEAWERLVRSSDLKIAQRALEKLSELNYKNGGARTEESRGYELDVSRTDLDEKLMT